MADELRQLVRARRQELGLSYNALASAAGTAGVAVSTGWLHRLEHGAPVVAPSAEVLGALAAGLRMERVQLQEAAAAQFFGLRLDWEASGEAGELLAALAVVPEPQRRALVDLIRVLAKGH